MSLINEFNFICKHNLLENYKCNNLDDDNSYIIYYGDKFVCVKLEIIGDNMVNKLSISYENEYYDLTIILNGLIISAEIDGDYKNKIKQLTDDVLLTFGNCVYVNNILSNNNNNNCYFEILNGIYDIDEKTIMCDNDEIFKAMKLNNFESNSSISYIMDKHESKKLPINIIIDKFILMKLFNSILHFIFSKFTTCYNCGNYLPIEMPKISICDNELCLFSLEQFGLGVELPDYKTIDIILNCFYGFATKGRKGITEKIMLDQIIKNKQLLPKINSVKYYEMKKYNINSLNDKIYDNKLKMSDYSNLDELKTMLLVVTKIYAIIRSCIVHESEPETIYEYYEQICGKPKNKINIYNIVANSPLKEKEFQDKKQIYGSVNAYHGSAYANWFTIIMHGLKNYSNTSLMSNGAAYGSGIYCSDKMEVSLRYSQVGVNRFNNNEIIISVVEIINVPDGEGVFWAKSSGQTNPHIRVINESLISIRQLIVLNC